MTDESDSTHLRDGEAIRQPRTLVWLLVGAALAVVSITLFLLNLPATPALAWIGIAFEVAFAAGLVASALFVRSDRYRGKNLIACVIGMAGVAVVLLVAILVVRLTTGV